MSILGVVLFQHFFTRGKQLPFLDQTAISYLHLSLKPVLEWRQQENCVTVEAQHNHVYNLGFNDL